MRIMTAIMMTARMVCLGILNTGSTTAIGKSIALDGGEGVGAARLRLSVMIESRLKKWLKKVGFRPLQPE